MTARRCRIEFERIGTTGNRSWIWRFFAANGEQTGRSSEATRKRVDAIRSAEVTTGCFDIRDNERHDKPWCNRYLDDPDSDDYYVRTRIERIDVRWIRP